MNSQSPRSTRCCKRDRGFGTHLGDLQHVDGGFGIEFAQDAIVVLRMPRVREDDDAPAGSGVEQGSRDVDIAVVGDDEHRAARLGFGRLERRNLRHDDGAGRHPAHPGGETVERTARKDRKCR